MYDREKRNPLFVADIGLSVRKVSNGYSVKINHSIIDNQVGSIIVANGKEEVLGIIGDLFDACDQVPKAKGRGAFYGDAGNEPQDCGDPDTEPE